MTMKPALLFVVAVTLGLVATTFAAVASADKTKALMQAKLEHSQALLKGLATEDFAGLEKSSNALTLLSLENDWNVIQTAEYRRLSQDFRRSTKALTESAKAKNLEGATLAYVGVTMKCVECHKYVRSVEVGETP
jgi:hypothetical protein